ncbi:MAG: 50S ribosomal protein L30 [Nitrososphaerota archaeon]
MKSTLNKAPLIVVIRVRGPWGMDAETEQTLRMLHLKRSNHAVVLPLNPSVRGVLNKVGSYITWGEATQDMLVMLFKRGDPQPGVKVEEELKRLGVAGLKELAKKLCDGELGVDVLRKIFKPAFRLHPPRGGFKGSIKRPISQKGVLGYAGEKIGRLLEAMC